VLGFARPGRPVLVAAAAGALVLAAGCSASSGHADKPASSNPASSPPRASTSPSPTAAQAARSALAAYDGMRRQMQAAGVAANWQDPGLARYASGTALNTLVSGLHNDHNGGLVIKGTLVIHPQVISEQPAANPEQVVISDCTDQPGRNAVCAPSGAGAMASSSIDHVAGSGSADRSAEIVMSWAAPDSSIAPAPGSAGNSGSLGYPSGGQQCGCRGSGCVWLCGHQSLLGASTNVSAPTRLPGTPNHHPRPRRTACR